MACSQSCYFRWFRRSRSLLPGGSGLLEWCPGEQQPLLALSVEHDLGFGTITIADYFGSAFVSLAEFIRCDFGGYPNLNRWYQRMKGLKSWNKVHEVFYGFAGSMKDAAFERL